ncbi:MAG: transposase [Allgaiera sp.]|jgi:transposase|nr:transposase [Allgaiera sp.]
MSCAKVISHFEVFPAGELGRRRTWSDAEKLGIVEESYRGHRQGSVVARRHGVSRALLTQWRKAYHLGILDGGATAFSPVEIAPDVRPERRGSLPAAEARAGERIKITLSNGRRLSVGTSIDAVVLTRLIQVLERA